MVRLPIALAAFAVVAASATSALAAGDKAFLKKAVEGDNSEMTLGQIAQQKGGSASLRDFGRLLNTDHAKAKSEAAPIAQAHGLPPSDEMAPEAKKEQDKLQGLSGPAFDKEFARYMVKDHKKDIAAFEKQAKKGDPQTAELARKTLPVLQKHLATAERLAK